MKFDFYAWQKAGRPASPAFGSSAYDDRVHWKFNTPEDYEAAYIDGAGWVVVARVGYFDVPQEFLTRVV